MKILLADDHTLVRENLSVFLSKLAPDVDVLEAGSFDAFEDFLAHGLDSCWLLVVFEQVRPSLACSLETVLFSPFGDCCMVTGQ